MKKLLFAFLFIVSNCSIVNSQTVHLDIFPIETDANMDSNAAKHRIFFNPEITSLNKLFIMLPGTNGLPEMYDEITIVAANIGYHAISLSYPNYSSISELCKFDSDPNCSEKARMEIITGEDLHPTIDVNEDNCIINRILKLLQFLNDSYPNVGWGNYFDNENIFWEKIAVGGHSQGGGHSALLGKNNSLHRVLFFNSPSDANQFGELPSWISTDHITPSNHYFAFFHWQNGGQNRLDVYEKFGILENGPEKNIDSNQPPYDHSHVLFTDELTFDMTGFDNLGGADPHNDIIVDHELIVDASGQSAFKEVWEYMLLEDINTSTGQLDFEPESDVQIFPNPSNGTFHVKTKDFQAEFMEVYDAKGRLLSEIPFTANLDLTYLGKGFYFLKLWKREEYRIERIFIQE